MGRAKMAEVVILGQAATQAVSGYYDANGKLPQTLAEAGFARTSPAVEKLYFDRRSGAIEVLVAAGPAKGKVLEFVPTLGGDKSIQWRCTSDDIAAKLLPPQCRR